MTLTFSRTCEHGWRINVGSVPAFLVPGHQALDTFFFSFIMDDDLVDLNHMQLFSLIGFWD